MTAGSPLTSSIPPTDRTFRRPRLLLALLCLAAACRPPGELPPAADLTRRLSLAEIRHEVELLDFTASLEDLYATGFYPAEDTARWSSGEASALDLFVAEARPLELVLRCSPFAPPGVEAQTMEVEVNGHSVGHLELTGGMVGEYRVAVPARRWRRGVNRLTFRYGHVLSPAQLGLGSDRRRLAVAWESLRIEGARAVAPDLVRVAGDPPTLVLPFGVRVDYYFDLPQGGELEIGELRPWGDASDSALLRVEVARDLGGSDEIRVRADGAGPVRYRFPAVGPVRLSLSALPAREPTQRAGLRLTAPLLRAARLGDAELTAQAAVADVAAPPGEEVDAFAEPGREPGAAAGTETAAEPGSQPRREPGAAGPPNVVVYLVDTLRADHLGAYGYERGTSPSIDRFAADSVLFEQAIAQTSWTRPAVATLLTGLQPQSHGTNGRLDALPAALPVLPELLRDAGYYTAAFLTNGNVGPAFGFGRGFDHVRRMRERKYGAVHWRADEVNGEVFHWLDERPADRPFLLWIHVSDPHGPYTPTPEFRRRFAPGVDDPDLGSLPMLAALEAGGGDPEHGPVRDLMALYDGEIAFMDEQLGLLLDRLRRDGVYDDAVIVLVADHGEAFGEHDHWGHGNDLHQEQIRVPFVVHLPGGEAGGRRVASLVQQTDLLPTLLDLAGVAPPPGIQGRSLRPWMTGAGDGRDARGELAWSYLAKDALRKQAVIGERYKLIWNRGDASGELYRLYDLHQDPAEQTDLSPRRPVRAGYLRSLLRFVDYAWQPRAQVEEGTMDAELEERLRALGYLR